MSADDLNREDLELATRVLQRDAAALEEFERRLLRVVKACVARAGDAHVDEVAQRVRERLLVGSTPRLAAYRGNGALAVYLKAVVLSVNIDLRRAAKPREDSSDEGLMRATALDENADERLAHSAHKQHFTKAFKAALATLSAEERTWLRMRFVDGLSVEAVASAFGVHRTTAMRWLESAQKSLQRETRRGLATQLGLRPSEVNALMREMRHSLAENLSRLLPRQ